MIEHQLPARAQAPSLPHRTRGPHLPPRPSLFSTLRRRYLVAIGAKVEPRCC